MKRSQRAEKEYKEQPRLKSQMENAPYNATFLPSYKRCAPHQAPRSSSSATRQRPYHAQCPLIAVARTVSDVTLPAARLYDAHTRPCCSALSSKI